MKKSITFDKIIRLLFLLGLILWIGLIASKISFNVKPYSEPEIRVRKTTYTLPDGTILKDCDSTDGKPPCFSGNTIFLR